MRDYVGMFYDWAVGSQLEAEFRPYNPLLNKTLVMDTNELAFRVFVYLSIFHITLCAIKGIMRLIWHYSQTSSPPLIGNTPPQPGPHSTAPQPTLADLRRQQMEMNEGLLRLLAQISQDKQARMENLHKSRRERSARHAARGQGGEALGDSSDSDSSDSSDDCSGAPGARGGVAGGSGRTATGPSQTGAQSINAPSTSQDAQNESQTAQNQQTTARISAEHVALAESESERMKAMLERGKNSSNPYYRSPVLGRLNELQKKAEAAARKEPEQPIPAIQGQAQAVVGQSQFAQSRVLPSTQRDLDQKASPRQQTSFCESSTMQPTAAAEAPAIPVAATPSIEAANATVATSTVESTVKPLAPQMPKKLGIFQSVLKSTPEKLGALYNVAMKYTGLGAGATEPIQTTATENASKVANTPEEDIIAEGNAIAEDAIAKEAAAAAWDAQCEEEERRLQQEREWEKAEYERADMMKRKPEERLKLMEEDRQSWKNLDGEALFVHLRHFANIYGLHNLTSAERRELEMLRADVKRADARKKLALTEQRAKIA